MKAAPFYGIGTQELLILLVILAVFVAYPIWEIFRSKEKDLGTKILWTLILVLFTGVGLILYLAFGRRKNH